MSIALDRVLQRLPHARHVGGAWSARCPAHDDASPSLSIREGRDGVLVRCWAGCELEAIVSALGLRVGDLFDAPKARTLPERPQRPPTAAEVEGALRHHLARIMAEETARLGYAPPVISRHINRARLAVNCILATALKPVAPAWWEVWPHTEDPLWPMLAERALSEIMAARGHAEPTVLDFIDAEDRAAAWLRVEARRKHTTFAGAA